MISRGSADRTIGPKAAAGAGASSYYSADSGAFTKVAKSKPAYQPSGARDKQYHTNSSAQAALSAPNPVSQFESISHTVTPNMAQRAPRFSVKEMSPEVDVHKPGIGEAAAGASITMQQGAPRFFVPEHVTATLPALDPEATVFDNIPSGTQAAFMQTGSKGGADRSAGWLNDKDRDTAPDPYEKDGAFPRVSTAPSAEFAAGGARFHIEPAGPEMYSDGDSGSLGAAVRAQGKPSSNFAAGTPVRMAVQPAGPELSGNQPSAFKGF